MDEVELTKKKTLLIGLVYMWVHFMILIFFVSTNATHKTVLCVAWAINILTIFLLCRKKGILLASRLLTVAWVLNITNTAWNTGGLYSTSMLWQVMFIFILATYLDRKAALWVTFYVIFTYVIFFYLQYSGLKNFKIEIQNNPPYYELVSVVSLFVVILCSLYFIFTEESFNRVWKKEKEVKIDTLETELNKKLEEIGILRNKIARDFHDEMGNKLASIRLLSENLTVKTEKDILENEDLLQTLRIIEKNAKELFDGTKDFIWSIGFNAENVFDVFVYIREFSENFLSQFDINLHAESDFYKNDNFKIDPTSSRQLIFVIKEILTNTAKHAVANQVDLIFCLIDNELKITLKDNGIGFDTTNVKLRGLKNIEYRLNRINARFNCRSAETGTSYEIFLKF